MIKYNNSNINDWNYGDDNIIKVYRNNAVCYYKVISSGDTPAQVPCYAVVDDISQYSDREFVDVYDNATDKWYKLNNLNQYEEYGIYGDSIATSVPSRLPQGYTEVEYVENNTKGAYINTNLLLYDVTGNSFSISAKLSSEYYSASGYDDLETLINNESISSPYYGFTYRYAHSTHVLEGSCKPSNSVTFSSTANTDGTSSLTINCNSTTVTDQVPLGLFASYDGNYNTPYRWAYMKLYSFQVTKNNTLVRDLVPCERDSDNMVGLYDLVNDVFYYPPNYNSYQLVAGSAVTPTAATFYQGKLAIVDGYEYMYSGSSWNNVGEVSGSSRVPQGYTEVEYIENSTSGTNYYIDTQFKPNQDTRVILEAQPSVLNNNPRMFGSGPWNGLAFVGNIENLSSQKFYFKYGQTSTWYTTNIQADTNKHTFDLNKNSYYIDGVLANTASTSTFQLTTNLGIFNAPATSLFNDTETFIGKVFSCKVYDNGTLIRDFVPCKRDSDSKSGLYDVVNDVFYSAVNTSYNFILGAETGSTEYPLYYDEKSDPPNNLTFSSMTEAEEYECPWVGMNATIDGVSYVFSGDSQSGYEWVNSSTLPNYLRFVARQNGSFRLSGNTVEYSLDSGTTWTELASDTESPSVSSGSIIMWKATNPPLVTNNGIGRFYSTGQFDVEGNIMSLIYGDDFETATTISNDGQFISLFYGNLNLINASGMTLPSTNVPANGYRSMFTNCTNLVTAPSLPATTLADNCYYSMFEGCTSLTTAPSGLPATTLTDYCYNSMFKGCTSLTTAPSLPATTLAQYCYSYMFYNCTSLTTAPVLPATTLAVGCYESMFRKCTSLTTAPELPATTLATFCYYYMFQGCNSMAYIKCLATDISATNCTTSWVSGVASSGTFTKAASMNDWSIGRKGIPSGWTVEDYSS